METTQASVKFWLSHTQHCHAQQGQDAIWQAGQPQGLKPEMRGQACHACKSHYPHLSRNRRVQGLEAAVPSLTRCRWQRLRLFLFALGLRVGPLHTSHQRVRHGWPQKSKNPSKEKRGCRKRTRTSTRNMNPSHGWKNLVIPGRGRTSHGFEGALRRAGSCMASRPSRHDQTDVWVSLDVAVYCFKSYKAFCC